MNTDLRTDKSQPWSCANCCCGTEGHIKYCGLVKAQESGFWIAIAVQNCVEHKTVCDYCGMREVMKWHTEPEAEAGKANFEFETGRIRHSNIPMPPVGWPHIVPTGGFISEVPKMTIIPPYMDLRDWFAGMALFGIMQLRGNDGNPIWAYPKDCAYQSYEQADAILAERERKSLKPGDVVCDDCANIYVIEEPDKEGYYIEFAFSLLKRNKIRHVTYVKNAFSRLYKIGTLGNRYDKKKGWVD
jgi:hypothetical protein